MRAHVSRAVEADDRLRGYDASRDLPQDQIVTGLLFSYTQTQPMGQEDRIG